MKVAAIQFSPTFGDKAASLKKLAELVITAAQAGARLIVMPELAVTGYSFMNPAEANLQAEVISSFKPGPDVDPDSSLSVFGSLSARYNVALVWGLIEKDAGTQKLYNSQVYLDSMGYLESYRKINPFGNDFLWATAGNANPPIIHSELLGKRVGLLICRDVRDKKNDEWNNFYSKGDADIVAFSANWGDGGFPSNSWMDFVEENNVSLIVSNRYGQETCNNFGEGGSCVILPKGTSEHPHGVYCDGLVWNQDCIVYAEIP